MKVQKAAPKHGPFHTLVTIIASLIVLGGFGMGAWFFIFFRKYEETNDAQVEQYVTPVLTRVGGYVKEVRYNENQFVHKGDTLVVIDDREYKARMDLAEADIQAAAGNIDVLQKDAATVQSNIAIHQSQVDEAKVQVWKAEQEYSRYAALLKEDAATEQQVEQVKAAYETAKAKYAEMQRAVAATELNTSAATAKLPVARHVISAKKAVADNAALYLSYTVITAPYDGWAGRKTIQPGQVVKEGQTLVVVVSQEKWVAANFKETQVGNIKVGQPVTFKADATGGKVYKGVVESFSPASGARFSMLPPDNATGNFVKIEQRIPIRIKITDSSAATNFLRAGMNVTVIARHNK